MHVRTYRYLSVCRENKTLAKRKKHLWRIGYLFHEVCDTTEYTVWRTHRNRLADFPADDSRISPAMLVHSRPLHPRCVSVPLPGWELRGPSEHGGRLYHRRLHLRGGRRCSPAQRQSRPPGRNSLSSSPYTIPYPDPDWIRIHLRKCYLQYIWI